MKNDNILNYREMGDKIEIIHSKQIIKDIF